MKAFDTGECTVWLEKTGVTMRVGYGYDEGFLSKKEIVKLIAFLVKALARLK